MAVRIERLDKMLGRFDPKLTISQDRQHLAFSTPPTDILLIAQELLNVKIQVKCRVQLVGRELARIDEEVQLLDLESQEAQDSELWVVKALVEQLMSQVKGQGKVSDPTPRLQGQEEDDHHHHHHNIERQELHVVEGQEIPIMKKKDLEGSQMRVGKEDRTRDLHPRRKEKTMKLRTTNS